MVKKVLCILLSVVMLLGCTACREQNTNQDKREYLELVDSPSTTLDNVWYNTGGIFRNAVFESLLSVEADMNTIKPALAKSFERAKDGLSYEFVLREGVKWHDGEVFDGEDVVFSIKTALRSSEVNGIISSAFQYIVGAMAYQDGETEELEGVTVEGNKLTIRLTNAIGFYHAIAQFAILPEHILRDADPTKLESHEYWKKPVGCGIYRITEAAEGEYFILEKNKDYYGKKAGIEKIRLRLNVEDCVDAMEKGELAFYVTNDSEEIAALKGVQDCSSHRLNIMFPTYLIFNLSQDPDVNADLKDVRVRKALLMAIDRETVVDMIFPGSSVSDTMVPSWDSWYLEEGENFAYNPEKAKELLEEAGFDFSKTIRLRYFTKGQATADLMSAIAVYWRAIGLDVSLEKFEGSGSKHMFELRDYDVCFKRLSAFNYAAIYEELDGASVMQTSIYNQPVYDEFINKLDKTLDEEDRKALIMKLQEVDKEYMLRLPLFSLATVAYVNDAHFNMPDAYGNLWYRYDLHFENWTLVN